MHCDNRSSEWSAFVSTLCQENSLPLNLKGRKEKNAFFQKYVSKHPPAVSQRKIIASSSRNLLVNFPKFQIQSTLFKQN